MDAFDEALGRYASGQFGDEDVMRCTGLSRRAWRELIKTKAVATITQHEGGRGYVRRCDATVLKRAAVIGALNRAGFSLAVSGFIAYSLPFHTLLYETVDPWRILFGRLPDPTGAGSPLQERVRRPTADWFAPHKPAKTEPENDWLISVFDGRFVGATYRAKEKPFIFGDLRSDATGFVAWWPLPTSSPRMGPVIQKFLEGRSPNFLDYVRDLPDPPRRSRELKALGYKYEKHNEDHDPLCIAAQASLNSPTITTTVNVSLTIRKALRRYLNVEPSMPDSASASR